MVDSGAGVFFLKFMIFIYYLFFLELLIAFLYYFFIYRRKEKRNRVLEKHSFCIHCGYEFQRSSNYCIKCGKRISKDMIVKEKIKNKYIIDETLKIVLKGIGLGFFIFIIFLLCLYTLDSILRILFNILIKY